ncbi:Serine/threonine-protein kinase SRPK [Paramyrothecium foliicola]|nr:Serine/threonine-protein kinase SRPK [Paramyrothecium foliicola]
MPRLLSGNLRQLGRLITAQTPKARLSTIASNPNPNTNPPRLITKPIDEETLPSYRPEQYHPTAPGQLYGAYRTITKIGYGAGSTVWLAENTSWTERKNKRPRYLVIKVATTDPDGTVAATREMEIAKLVASNYDSHPGARFVRTPIDSFEIKSPNGRHPCLVYLPMRETLFRFQGRLGGRRLSRPLVKLYTAHLLQALDFLHTECHLIHTDLKDDNVLMTLENDNVLDQFLKAQENESLPRHIREDGTTVFLSRADLGPLQGYSLKPRLTDFDLAFPLLPDNELHVYPAIQPARYRAPEVILGTGWSSSADIWNLGLMMWNLLQDINLFNGLFDADGKYDARVHLAQMISLLGPPPEQLVQRERQFRNLAFEDAVPNPQGRMVKTVCDYWGGPFFDSHGEFLYKELIQQDHKLEDTVTEIEGFEKEQFLDFARSMLHWLPEKRKTAAQLLEHPFILSLEHEE